VDSDTLFGPPVHQPDTHPYDSQRSPTDRSTRQEASNSTKIRMKRISSHEKKNGILTSAGVRNVVSEATGRESHVGVHLVPLGRSGTQLLRALEFNPTSPVLRIRHAPWSVQRYSTGTPSRITVLVSRNGKRPSVPPSRPMPDCLNPPKAMLKSVRNAL
jgi:hypothetical protein